MSKAPYFFFFFFFFLWGGGGLRVHVISLNFIAFIVSIETQASVLALAKSTYWFYTILYVEGRELSLNQQTLLFYAHKERLFIEKKNYHCVDTLC